MTKTTKPSALALELAKMLLPDTWAEDSDGGAIPGTHHVPTAERVEAAEVIDAEIRPLVEALRRIAGGWEVVCFDGRRRHPEVFASRRQAAQFAEWGHICCAKHALRRCGPDVQEAREIASAALARAEGR